MKCFMFLLMNFKLFVWGLVLVGFDTIESIDYFKLFVWGFVGFDTIESIDFIKLFVWGFVLVGFDTIE
jgi:hypothetical protein